MLAGRQREQEALIRLLDSVRRGFSATLVLRGEAGIGKSALIEYAVANATDLRIVRVVGIQSELELGFAGVGFSPMLKSPRGVGEMNSDQLARFLAEMIACGELAEARLAAGETYGFLNLMTALQEIHKGTHRPYPCARVLGMSPHRPGSMSR